MSIPSRTRSGVFLSAEHCATLRSLLKECMHTWILQAHELDQHTAPSTAAGDVCRKWYHAARLLRVKLRVRSP